MTRHTHTSQRFRLDGKVAPITGASKGIGAVMAHKAGANLVPGWHSAAANRGRNCARGRVFATAAIARTSTNGRK